MRRMLALNFLIGLMLLTPAIHVRGQVKQRIVNELYLPKDAPIQIIDRELEGKKFEDKRVGNRVVGLANSDWIKHLTFVVKNVSRRNVSYIRITLMLPKQKRMPGPMVYELSFGSRNDSDELIRPGETASLKVRDDEYLGWEKKLKEWGVDDIDQVLLELRTILFDDGTGWSLGRDIIRDPLNPKKWNHVDQPSQSPSRG